VFPPELQVKQYVARVRGAHGFLWDVYRVGSDKHYLFACVQNPTFQVPVLKADLQPEIRSALAHGFGHAA
jgi:hypothetical protein